MTQRKRVTLVLGAYCTRYRGFLIASAKFIHIVRILHVVTVVGDHTY